MGFYCILDKHPAFQSDWLAVLNEMDPADREQALFLLAARWPDDVREPFDNPEHRRVWHFADQANPGFARANFPQLATADPAEWAKEGFAIGRKVVRKRRGAPVRRRTTQQKPVPPAAGAVPRHAGRRALV